MRQLRKIFHILVCLASLGFALDAHADLTLEAALSQLSFAVDQQAMLTITAHGASRISAIELPEIAGIAFHNRGQSSRINVVNGSMSSSFTNSYLIEAQKPGIYTIPPIKVTAGSESATTRPLSFEVTATAAPSGGSAGNAEQSTEEVAFIRIPEISDHYPGEIVPITIKAYFNQRYRADINSLPTLQGDGVVMPQLREKPSQTQEVVRGIPYNVLVWNTVLSGIKAGRHPLTFSMEASLLIAQKRRQMSPFGGGSPFDDPAFNDPLFDSFFGGYQRKPLAVVSPEVVFNVVPLPTTDQPKNFTGAIGDFTMRVTTNRQEVEVGEPLTLKVEISGNGNFDRVEAPVFPDSADWKTYAPTSSASDQGNSAFGTKVFDQAIVARNGAATEIPALSFSYFDPVQKRYVTRTSKPIAIRLQKSAAPQPPPPPAKAPEPPRPEAPAEPGHRFEGMAPLHVEAGGFVPTIVPLFARTWFLGIFALCVLLLLALGIWRLRRARLARFPEKVLRRRQKEMLAFDLRQVEQANMAGNSLEFLALCRTAIQNQLGLSWRMAPTAISLADLRSRLHPESRLLEIFSVADEAAYGGATLSPEKMRDYLGQMKKELEELP
jgi:hypothetical protein